jgi:hypothetical protein
MDRALRQWLMSTIGLGPGIGEVHYACKANSAYYAWLRDDLREEPAYIHYTIADALANTTASRNDVVVILPGTYAESVAVASLNSTHLIGFSANSVIIAPTASHALLVGADGTASSTMTNSLIKNITFYTPSTSNPTYAALCIAYMTKSVIEDCKFMGTTVTGFQPSETVGLQISNRTYTEWEFHEHSRISRCEFTTSAARTKELGIAIRVGAATNTTPSYRGFKSMIIEDCIIGAYDTGILLNTGASSCNGSVIRRNIITSHQGGSGPNEGIVSQADDGTDALCMLVDNKITAISDCIKNFSACNCQGNIVSVGTATPDTEYLDGS